MLKEVVLFIVLSMLLIAIFCIFNARGIVKLKYKKEEININEKVNIVKIIGTILLVLSLLIIYFLR